MKKQEKTPLKDTCMGVGVILSFGLVITDFPFPAVQIGEYLVSYRLFALVVALGIIVLGALLGAVNTIAACKAQSMKTSQSSDPADSAAISNDSPSSPMPLGEVIVPQ
jgi:hypothetical protein